MSSEESTAGTSKLSEYLQVWTASIARVLQEVSGTPHTPQELPAEALQTELASLQSDGVSARFEAAQHLSGEQGFLLSKGDGVRLAQLLLTEAQDPNVAMTDEHRDALGELFRQFAGAAASGMKGLAGGEVGFQWSGFEPLGATPAVRVGLRWTSEKLQPFTMIAEIGPVLAASLNPVAPPAPREAAPAPPPLAASPSQLAASPAQLAAAPSRDPKLELLMDVELDVSLRFGERLMNLRSVLDLNTGSVVELDQHVRDPVELLVGGKVIAQGEVVIVDGNYGLRVTQIVSPTERIESLRR